MRAEKNTNTKGIFWNRDEKLFDIVRSELYTAVIGDIMDKKGLFRQFLPPRIQPLNPDMFVIGRAMTVLEADVMDVPTSSYHNPILDQPFGLMLDALDDLKRNEVYVCSGASPRFAVWGELMATRANVLGAAGAVVNGYSRDTKGLLKLGLPCFSIGRYAQDQAPRGKVIDWRVPIDIDGVVVSPGDIVIGDIDGVCIVPQSREREILEEAIEKARGEKKVEKEIRNGMGAKKAFEKYGIM